MPGQQSRTGCSSSLLALLRATGQGVALVKHLHACLLLNLQCMFALWEQMYTAE